MPAHEPVSFTLQDDMALLKSAMVEGAALARRYFETGAEFWNKRPGQPVTDADLAVDALLKERLCGPRPDYGWLSEEGHDDPARLETTKLWIIDPIDGTRAFIRRRPQWTVCGALIEGGRPRAGVVINPMTEEVFEAIEGSGACRNGIPIQVSSRTELDGATLIGTKEFYTHPSWPEPWPATLIFDNPNSIAYRLCLIAMGARDGAVRLFSCHEWDIAAAEIILLEAGGRMTRHDGSPLAYNQPSPIQKSFIAAGPDLYPELYRRAHKMMPRSG